MIPEWTLLQHFNGRHEHWAAYRDEALKATMAVFTPVRHGKFGEQEASFAMDGDDRVFRTEDDLIAALQNKHRHKLYFIERVK